MVQRGLWLCLVLSACGGPSANRSGESRDALITKGNTNQCLNLGRSDRCAEAGRGLLAATPPDRVTAKTVLMKACSGDDKVSVETRRETCGVAIDAKLLEENELVTLCSTNVNTCKPVIEKGGLSEDHVFQFCMENEGACGD